MWLQTIDIVCNQLDGGDRQLTIASAFLQRDQSLKLDGAMAMVDFGPGVVSLPAFTDQQTTCQMQVDAGGLVSNHPSEPGLLTFQLTGSSCRGLLIRSLACFTYTWV